MASSVKQAPPAVRAGPPKASNGSVGGPLSAIDAADKAISYALFRAATAIVPRQVFMLIEEGGDGVFWIVGTLLLFLWPGLPDVDRAFVANLFLGLFVDLAFIGSSKALFRRPRPQYNADDMHVVAAVDNYSFPSGHASRVGFVVTYIYLSYAARALPLCEAVVVWGVLTALSRAMMGRHYVGDVVAGIALGLCTTAVLTKGTFAPGAEWIAQSTALAAYASASERVSAFAAWSGVAPVLAALGERYAAYVDSVQGALGAAAGAVGEAAGEVAAAAAAVVQ